MIFYQIIRQPTIVHCLKHSTEGHEIRVRIPIFLINKFIALIRFPFCCNNFFLALNNQIFAKTCPKLADKKN